MSLPDGRVTGFGLVIGSALAIPGATPIGPAPSDLDVRVTLAPTAPEPAPAEPLYRLEDDTLIFAAPEAVYRCRRDEVAISPRPDVDLDAVIGLLIATALPAVLWLRGGFVLHAAAVVRPSGGALAIMGPSGAGKSTVATQLIADGAMLLADDSLMLELAGGAVMGSGLSGGYHLADAPGAARAFHTLPPGRTTDWAPLRAALVLSRTDGPPGIARLGPIDALQQLLAGQHRPRIPVLLGRRAEVLDFCVQLARQTPVYSWRRNGPRITRAERAALARELAW
jgi:hypothetical protein